MDDDTLKKYAYISISDYRRRTLQTLKNQVKTPTQISKDIGIRRNHVSKVLADLKEIDLAECINEEAYRGRIYRLTYEGKEVVELLENEKPENEGT